MEDVVILEWTFSPPDYFEQSIQISRDDYEITIENGKIEARVSPDSYDNEPNLREQLHNSVSNRFLGVLLLTHEPYELSRASMYRLHPDGSKVWYLHPASCSAKSFTSRPDILLKDENGNIINDTFKERIDRKRGLADLVEKHCARNPLVASLLASYNKAVRDPANEFLHLYEIRDALSTRFGGKTAAQNAIGISSKKWSRLRQLTNNANIKQSRHRGMVKGALRDATEEELKEARNIARELVESYLEYANNH